MARKISELPSFLISLQKGRLLLPSNSVAEIIPYEPLQRSQDTPDWFLGLLSWRSLQVPVVSFEMLSVRRARFSLISVSSASLVICTGISGNKEIPYFALVAQVMPTLRRVIPDELIETGEEALPTELMKILYRGEPAAIPNVEYLEQQLATIDYL